MYLNLNEFSPYFPLPSYYRVDGILYGWSVIAEVLLAMNNPVESLTYSSERAGWIGTQTKASLSSKSGLLQAAFKLNKQSWLPSLCD